jgi:hypothetical protein
MHPNRPAQPGSPGDPASHLQFQISLLRLMGHKMIGQKMTGQKMTGQKMTGRGMTGQKGGAKIGSSLQAPSAQVVELERLQQPQPAKVRLKPRS